MPRYFFHSENGGSYIDPQGVELPDLAAARVEATRFLAEVLRDQGEAFFRAGRLQLSVTDEGGSVVLVLSLASAEPPALPRAEGSADPAQDRPAPQAPPNPGRDDPYEIHDGGAGRATQAARREGGGADAGATIDDPGRGGD